MSFDSPAQWRKIFVRAAIKLFLHVLKQIYGRSQSLSESHLPLTGKIRYVNHLEIGTNVDNKTDPIHILQGFGLNEKMTVMIKSQLENMNKNPHGRRWDQDIIRMCLTFYCRSPKNYEYLSKAGYLILPSAQQIQRYKNKVQQNTGINKEVLEWMKSEAVFRELPKEGYDGGLLVDEMSLQEDLRLKRTGNEFELIGFVDTGEYALPCKTLSVNC